jgi:hypothetical protein
MPEEQARWAAERMAQFELKRRLPMDLALVV